MPWYATGESAKEISLQLILRIELWRLGKSIRLILVLAGMRKVTNHNWNVGNDKIEL